MERKRERMKEDKKRGILNTVFLSVSLSLPVLFNGVSSLVKGQRFDEVLAYLTGLGLQAWGDVGL
jgi:hypothetical protein